jgi:peptide/nickel transport system substrate-binding protein
MKKMFTCLVIFTLIVGIALTGCSSNKASDTQKAAVKDTITIALQGEPSTMDVLFADDGNMRHVTNSVYETLTVLDGKTLEPVYLLATEGKNIDTTTWEFTLREGVKFHNGEAFTADDVVYSFKRCTDPALKSKTRNVGEQPLSCFPDIRCMVCGHAVARDGDQLHQLVRIAFHVVVNVP